MSKYNSNQPDDRESQLIEWKWSWQDEYLKWLCGYANAEGGTLYIGVNDDGYVVGVEDSKKMLESLPNKINNKLGIVACINIYTAKLLVFSYLLKYRTCMLTIQGEGFDVYK